MRSYSDFNDTVFSLEVYSKVNYNLCRYQRTWVL